MTPPPENNDDPFGGMDPMAWLESLAKRQGANLDELTTAADIDVPVPPADTVIDEPGYTPYDTGSSKPKPAEPAKAASPPVVQQPVAAQPDDPFGGMDPMAWLESLAKRQGANAEELTTAANIDVPMPPPDAKVSGPGYTPGYDTGKPKTAEPAKPEPKPTPPVQQPVAQKPVVPPPPPPAPPVQQPAAQQPVADDAFGGMDPMAWLESLAKRQGANVEELTTAANIDVPMPPPDAKVSGPGYTPGYDTGKPKAAEPVKPVDAGPDTKPIPPLAQPRVQQPAAQQPVAPPPAAVPTPPAQPAAQQPMTDDVLSSLDPLAWLESLARRQGANPDELVTGGNQELPAPPTNVVIDEPGYVDYTPFGDTPAPSEAIVTPSMSSAEAERLLGITADANPLNDMDPLAWLESLAAPDLSTAGSFGDLETPSMETSEAMEAASALSWLEELARENQTLPASTETIEDAWLETTLEPVDEAGGISDDLAEVQRWLNAQADSLASVRDQDELAEAVPAAEPTEVQPGDLPDWLKNQMPAASEAPLRNEILEPPIPADLPSWLRDNVEITDAAVELPLDLSEFRAPDSTPIQAMQPEPEAEISPDELAALVQPEAYEAPDPWAQALDEEYERRLAGDETIPDWYMEAVVRNTDEAQEVEAPEPQAALPPLPDVIKANDLPDWLKAMEEPAELPDAVQALPGDIPDWLLEGMPQELSSAAPEPALAETGLDDTNTDNWFDQIEPAELPDWLQPAAPPAAEVEPIPEFVPQATDSAPPAQVVLPPKPEPVPQPIAEPVSETVLANHAQRLRHARELLAQDRHSESLMHYESLIDDHAVLDDVIQDVGQLVQTQPKNPRARRLLGDAHLRKGNLQEALDTYRSALDQL